jgi:hypothetical protein
VGFIVLALVTYWGSIFLILRGNLKGIVGPIGATIVLVWALDVIFTDRIVFYQDRVVKIWNFLGQKTIYYSKAKVTGAPRNWQIQRSKWYQITETGDNGRRIWLQIPILYCAQFVPPDTAKRIDLIIDHLTGKNENRTRIFKERFLPIEVISRSSQIEG